MAASDSNQDHGAMTTFEPCTGPSDALRFKMATLASHRKLRAVVGLTPFHPAVADWSDDERLISKAGLYWWASDVANVVRTASASYPLSGDLYVPTLLQAFCVFEAPTLFIDIDGQSVALAALAWAVGRRVSSADTIALVIRGYAKTHGFGLISPVVYIDNTRRPIADADLQADCDYLTRWILTASMFVEQRLVLGADEPMSVERHIRKEAVKQSIEPLCRVVHLRRADRHDRSSTSSEEREWSCQWLVSGHWRNQWYGKAQRHVPRWIAPYVKGPDDKPLKVPKAEVFVVNR